MPCNIRRYEPLLQIIAEPPSNDASFWMLSWWYAVLIARHIRMVHPLGVFEFYHCTPLSLCTYFLEWLPSRSSESKTISHLLMVLMNTPDLIDQQSSIKHLVRRGFFLASLTSNLPEWTLVFLRFQVFDLPYTSSVIVCFCMRRLITASSMLSCLPIYLQDKTVLCISITCQHWLSVILRPRYYNMLEFRLEKSCFIKAKSHYEMLS